MIHPDEVLRFSTPEEYAAILKSTHALQSLVDQHNEGNRYATEADNEADDQFLYGQDFDTNPEVWELTESIFEDGGLFGPRDL